jgi:signal transduction histidine kinase
VTRALANLIDNALKFGASVKVRLRGTEETQEAVIEVEDDGPGIPDSQKESALEPFYRGDPARSLDDNGGFGLGLSIARSVAESHGGTLELLDAEPRGLLARLTLRQHRPTKQSLPNS